MSSGKLDIQTKESQVHIVLSSPGAIAFQIGPLPIRWYALCITAGFLLATWAASRITQQRHIEPDSLLDGAMLGFLGGIVGARLYFAALSWNTFHSPLEIFQIWNGGLSIHGGIIGGALVSWFYCRRTKLAFLDAMDVAGAVLPLAQAVGRWGNFFNSEAFGRPVDADFPLAVAIPPESRPAGLEQYSLFHPTFLYESIWNFLIFLPLYFIFFPKLKRYPGLTFAIYLLLYSIGRALIEPLRTDSIMVGTLAAPLVVSIALILLSGGGALWLFLHYKNKQKQSPEEEGLDASEHK